MESGHIILAVEPPAKTIRSTSPLDKISCLDFSTRPTPVLLWTGMDESVGWVAMTWKKKGSAIDKDLDWKGR